MTARTTAVRLPGPAEAFERVRGEPLAFLLETLAGAGPCLLGSRPFAVLAGDRLTRGRRTTRVKGDPFDALRALLAENAGRAGVAVAAFGYGLRRWIERVPESAREDLGYPDMIVACYDRYLMFDGASATIVEDSKRRPPAEFDPVLTPPKVAAGRLTSNFTRSEYLRAVARIQEYIAAGDVYQVNLSQRFLAPAPDPWALYGRLRAASPAPYMAFWNLGPGALLSASPELFLESRGGKAVTRPIKGTRPRGATPEEDARLRDALAASPKDDAELAMIVDLHRNDLGRVCEFGSVRVVEPKRIETHATVHHLVATIEGRLKGDAVDLLRAAFPGGSVTGCPKIRAMEIIDEIEPTHRSLYTGAIGTLGFDGSMSLSMAIRILQVNAGVLSVPVGGAVVADSDPEAEYEETLVKARGSFKALGL